MKKIKTTIIVTVSIFNAVKTKLFKNDENTKKILIVFPGIFGDCVCFYNTMKLYKKVFPEDKGYTLTFLVRPTIKKFLESFDKCDEYNIVEIDFTKYCNDIRYFFKINKLYRNQHYLYAITPAVAKSSALFVLNINRIHARTVRFDVKSKTFSNVLVNKIYDLAYDEQIILSDNDTILIQFYTIVNSFMPVTNKFKIRMPDIHCEFSKKNKRVIIAPFSSRKEKEWEMQKFVDVANYCIGAGFEIELCGNTNNENYFSDFSSMVEDKNKLHNYINKTSYREWIDLIASANLLVGSDSASVHIAAAVKTHSVCILGGMDEGKIYPYQVDIGTAEFAPYIITCERKECFKCNRGSGKFGFGNHECQKWIKRGNPMLCISEIKSSEVINVIDKNKYLEMETCIDANIK